MRFLFDDIARDILRAQIGDAFDGRKTSGSGMMTKNNNVRKIMTGQLVFVVATLDFQVQDLIVPSGSEMVAFRSADVFSSVEIATFFCGDTQVTFRGDGRGRHVNLSERTVGGRVQNHRPVSAMLRR